MENSRIQRRHLGRKLCVIVPIFLFGTIGGDIFGLMSNQACYTLFGCNVGFFGYDAMMHLLSGLVEVTLILWLVRKKPALNPFSSSFTKNVVIMVAICVLLGVLWELGEFTFDSYRIYVLHQDLFHPNLLAQASNSDTMGDLTFGMAGAYLSTLLYKLTDKRLL